MGGAEVHIAEFLDACIEVSAASGSAGWVMGVIGVHPWQLALFDEEVQNEMWGIDPATMHSSSYQPTGKDDVGTALDRVRGAGYHVIDGHRPPHQLARSRGER